MISVPDMAIIGALALMLFGPDQLPKVARKVGHVMRDVQNTSQSFIREMERAADDFEPPKPYYAAAEAAIPPALEAVPEQAVEDPPEPAAAPLPQPKREPEYRVE